jgi:hypothetical protein
VDSRTPHPPRFTASTGAVLATTDALVSPVVNTVETWTHSVG